MARDLIVFKSPADIMIKISKNLSLFILMDINIIFAFFIQFFYGGQSVLGSFGQEDGVASFILIKGSIF